MPRRKKRTIGKTRSVLYSTARILGDVQAVGSGRVGKRIVRRLVGRMMGHLLRELTK